MLIASSPGLMTRFTTSLALTILLGGWRQRKQPSRKHLPSVQMRAKRTSHEQTIFIADITTTMAPWLSWKLHAAACQMIQGYSRCWVPSKDVRGAGKKPYKPSNGQLSWTRATF